MSLLARDGIWTWFNTPVAFYDATSDLLVFGAYPRAIGRPTVGAVNVTTRAEVQYGHPSMTLQYETDDHDNPAMLLLASGKYLACFSEHNDDSVSYTSTNANSARLWNEGVTANTASADAYAQIQQVTFDDTIYWFFRRDEGGTDLQHWFRTSDDDGATWTSPVQLFDRPGERPYFRFFRTSGTRIDFAVNEGNPPEDVNSLYHGYMLVDASTGARTYYKSDGTLIGDDTALPLEIGDLTQVYDGTTSESWIWDCRHIDGQPTLVFTVFPSHATSSHEYWYARFNGTTWSVVEKICDAGTTGTADYLYTPVGDVYSGGICLDPTDENVVYTSREFGSGNFQIEKWTKSGTWSQTSNLSGDTSSVNARPVAVDCNGTTNILWWEGTYTSYTNYNTDVRIYPATSFRTEKIASNSPDPELAPLGTRLFLPLTEGTGTPADLQGNYTPSTVGSLTWANTSGFGDYLSGFGTSNYITIDSLASVFGGASSGARWIAVMFENTNTTTNQYLFSFGSSSTTTPFWGVAINATSSGGLAHYIRSDANVECYRTATSQPTNDGNRHVVMAVGLPGTSNNLLYMDGTAVGSAPGAAIGTVTFNQCSIGCLRRTTVTNPFLGKIYAVAIGYGAVPHAEALYDDWINGRFSGLGTDVAGPPSNSVAPAVTGTEANGKTLSCTTGTWSGADSYAYQWYTNTAASTSGGTAITGATSSTFVLTDSQDDLCVYCIVTATNGEGSDSEPSNVVGPILGLNVVVKANPTFADVANFQDQTLINEAVGDAGAGEEMPAPSTWETDSPVGDVDWSAFTLAVDAAGINRSNRAGATLISPNYVVLAAHAPGDNTGHTWMTPAGAEVTRTLGSTPDVDYWELGTGDLALAKLSAPINNITPMPMILDCSKVAGRDGLAIEMDRHLNVFTIPESLDNTDEDCTVSHSRASDGLESGDSGKPCVIIIDGTPVMVITAMFSASPGGPPFTATGPNASHFIDEIFAITAEDGESPTVWDLQIASGGRASGIANSFASAFSSTGFPFYF